MGVKKFEILSPEETEKQMETGCFPCHYADSDFQRWRFAVILNREFQKLGGDIPAIRWAPNMCADAGIPGIPADKYVILLQNIKNQDSPALKKAKDIARRPWWKFRGTIALIQLLFADIRKMFCRK